MTDLFITDNGSILCSEHLGAAARFTGRDISGQAIEKVTPAHDFDGLTPRCETCGKVAPR